MLMTVFQVGQAVPCRAIETHFFFTKATPRSLVTHLFVGIGVEHRVLLVTQSANGILLVTLYEIFVYTATFPGQEIRLLSPIVMPVVRLWGGLNLAMLIYASSLLRFMVVDPQLLRYTHKKS